MNRYEDMNLQKLKNLNRLTITLIIGAIVIAGGSLFYTIRQFKPKPPTISESAPVPEPIAALGRLEPNTEVLRVAAPTALNNDRVAKLLVKRGERVRAGQIIAILDSRERLQTALIEAQKQVSVAQAKLATVKAGAKSGEIAAQNSEIIRFQEELQGEIATQAATITRRQSEVNVAQSEYNRYMVLYKEGAIAASNLDQKRLTLETALAQLNEAKANRNRTADTLRAQINQAKSTLNKISEIRPVDVKLAQAEVDQAVATAQRTQAQLQEAYIRAPITGQVLEVYTKSGEAVAEEGIVELGETKIMEVVAEVYQSDINEIRLGQTATIKSESFSGELQGTVQQLGVKVKQQSVFSNQPGENLDQRVIEVRIRLNSNDSQKVASLTNLQVQVVIQKNI